MKKGGKRQQILDSAVAVFAEKGFYNAKVTDIAHKAGVAHGTVYLYFQTKEDILIQIFEEKFERISQLHLYGSWDRTQRCS